MWRAKSIGAVSLLLLAGACLSAAEDEAKVTIHVVNPNDRPVDNAEVVLDFLGSHQVAKLGRRHRVHWETRTNQEGLAEFPSIPQGAFRVQVISKKYQTFGDKYDVEEDQKTIDIKLNDPQPQYSAHPPLKPKDQ